MRAHSFHFSIAAITFGSLAITAMADPSPSGPTLSVDHPDSAWRIVVTPEGYSDLALDKRPGFIDREYLSGEWAAAIHYVGGKDPEEAIWFKRIFAFPCWTTNSDFDVLDSNDLIEGDQPFSFDTPSTNSDGASRFLSKISNGDLEITIRYEMVNSVTGVAQGSERNSTGGLGTFALITPYVLKQTYEIKNTSGETLTYAHLYQFLHGLESGSALQDNRDYSGAFGDYHYDSMQFGTMRSFNSDTGEIISHDDVIAMHAKMEPTEFEVGFYGREDVDDHVEGKPSEGVHLSVEAHSLNGLDFFTPAAPITRWVSGAMCFDLATLAPNATVSMDVLLSISTDSTFLAPPVNIDLLSTTGFDPSTNKMIIEFKETTNPPVNLGFAIRRSKNNHPGDAFPMDWDQIHVGGTISNGCIRFEVPVDPSDIRGFFRVQPQVQN